MESTPKELISENFSEKKKRGRPRLLSPEFEKGIRQSKPYCDIRTLQNEDYEARAVMILGFSPENPPNYPFLWLGDFSKIEIGKSGRRGYKKTILAELGRIRNTKKLINAATEICRLKPKTQEAIKIIRGWRLNQTVAPIPLELVLRKAIEDYKKQHQEITDNDIHNALEDLLTEYLEKSLTKIFKA